MATAYEFGPFRLDAEAEILFREGQPIVLGQRAVALLRLLLEHAGAPVSKDALFEAAWPGLTIEDSNLTVQIAAMRRAFGEAGGSDWIETLPRRGYRYVGPAVTIGEAPPAPLSASQQNSALALPDKPSVAVLPFTNLSGETEQEYFADGMVEDIIAGLSRIKWLFVIARHSSFAYKGTVIDVKQVAADLGVRYLVQGSVRKSGGRVRISAQMVEAETGVQLWSERFDRPIDDVFALQDEIALNVVSAIEPSLRRAEFARVKRKRPDSLDAYDIVLQAQPDVDSGMPAQVTKALVLLDRALKLDPTYALAHANAAMCHHCLYLRSGLREEDRLASVRYAKFGHCAWARRCARFNSCRVLHRHGRARPVSCLHRLGGGACDQSVKCTDLHPWQRDAWMGRRSGTRHRVERTGNASQPARFLGLRGLRRAGDGPFPSRPLR